MVNLILGIIFWIGLSTDYKLNNLSTDISFTWLVGIVGLTSWLLVAISSLSGAWKRLFSYFIAPSIVGSIPYLFLTIPIIGWSGSAFSAPVLVDKIEAPNHSKMIEVHYFPDLFNIYCGHSYQVSLHYYVMPILRRDIINLQNIANDPDPLCSYKNGRNTSIDTEIDWVDNDKIIVPDIYKGTQIVDTGSVKYNLPSTHIKFLLGDIGLLMVIHGIQRLREKQNGNT